MSYDDDDYEERGWYREGVPLPAARGVKARSQRGQIGEQWWSQRFVEVLEALGHGGTRLTRGKRYARKGQVMDVELGAGVATARVQGTRPSPYRVDLSVHEFTDAQWAALEEALAGQALYAASLLAGEMPHEIEDVLASVKLHLFPRSPRDLQMRCSCPDYALPCKHIAAFLYILAEAFDDDPFLILAWRGRKRETLLANLRALRGPEASAPSSETAAELEPLPSAAADFWRPADLTGLRYDFGERADAAALLHALGPLPAEAGGETATRRLAALYRAIAEGARALARGDTPDI